MMGKKGGKARFAKMTPEQKKEIATKASKAAAMERSADAKRKKNKTGVVSRIAFSCCSEIFPECGTVFQCLGVLQMKWIQRM